MLRSAASAILLALVLASCGGKASMPVDEVAPLPPIEPAAMEELLKASDRPVVLNVWASWCVPCRSEAPLLRQAHAAMGDRIRFVGVAVRDTQDGARAFIAEFGVDGLEHYFDPAGEVPASLAGFGVPITFFFAPGGRLVTAHNGVIDERTLALQTDELLRLVG